MFKIVKKRPAKGDYFMLHLDEFTKVLPSRKISVGVVTNRTKVYYDELVVKMVEEANLNFLQYVFRLADKQGTLVVITRSGSWVADGFIRYVKDHQKAFYMAWGLTLTEEEKQVLGTM